jgi:hypothetical protein
MFVSRGARPVPLGIWLSLCIVCLAVLTIRWGAGPGYVPLHPAGGFARDGEFPSRNHDVVTAPRYGSWSGSDANAGSLISDVFRAGVAVAFFVDGYPDEPGERLYLERVDGGEELTVRIARNPGERWTLAAYALPPSWYGARVRLHAVDASARELGWIGVAGVRDASLLETVVRFESPWYVVGWGFVLVVLALACAPALPVRGGTAFRVAAGPAAFLVAVFAALFFLRLPVITAGITVNADEGQMTAQAITFLRHPVPWVDFEGTTSGPLNSVVLAVPALAGFAPSLASSRLVGTCLLFVTLVCLYLTQRRWWDDLAARIGLVLPFALFGGGTDGAYAGYASEQLPMTLIAIAILCAAESWARPAASAWLAGVAGAVIGALPFAKLQSAPLAALLVAGWAVLIAVRTPRAAAFRRALAFAGGVAFVPALVVIVASARGGFHDFLVSYVLLPHTYVKENCCTVAGPGFFLSDAPFRAFFGLAACLTLALTAGLAVRARRTRVQIRKTAIVLGFFLLMAAVAVYAIEVPQTPFVHYLLFLVIPVAGIAGTLFGSFAATLHAGRARRFLIAAAAVAALASTAPLAAGALGDDFYLGHPLTRVQPPIDPEVAQLRARIRPGDRVAMWGWMPDYLVDTDAVMGTRDAISQFQIENRSFRGYYRARYLRDFTANRPAFLIEAVGPAMFAFHDRKTEGIESFPALRRVLGEAYTVVYDDGNVRLFERKP